ncbi:hypothetical protein CT0861_09310 [Colletotrichum tofieldiae]|uniref:Uncharacterized protein n=1 Tax=Colletotrichum tofieldiae TaxID=708197 RepID=A0A166YFC3_9PEZI|nr:hypothetical protein CT0861_09310 [Colletotrichum tofieldiae]
MPMCYSGFDMNWTLPFLKEIMNLKICESSQAKPTTRCWKDLGFGGVVGGNDAVRAALTSDTEGAHVARKPNAE